MSNTDHAEHGVDKDVASHEGPIKTPKQLVLTVFASFVVPILVIVLLANYVSFGNKEGAGSDGLKPEAVARRLQRVGSIEIRDANAPVVLRTGEEVFGGVCTACHTSGAAGAPKIGDEAAWAPRIRTGFDALWQSALKGKGAMPPQGGGDYADVEVGRAVVYMANKGGAKFADPPVPAAAAAAVDGAASAADTGAAPAAAAAAAPAASGAS